MRILGIDPGYERLGVAVLERIGNTDLVIFSTCFQTSSKTPFLDRLYRVGQEIDKIITQWKPEACAIEALYFAKNTKTAMKVAEVRGVIQYVIRDQNLDCYEYHPNTIKIAVAGHGGASKAEIALMIPRLVQLEIKGKIDDELDAIAVALTHLAHGRNHYPQISS